MSVSERKSAIAIKRALLGTDLHFFDTQLAHDALCYIEKAEERVVGHDKILKRFAELAKANRFRVDIIKRREGAVLDEADLPEIITSAKRCLRLSIAGDKTPIFFVFFSRDGDTCMINQLYFCASPKYIPEFRTKDYTDEQRDLYTQAPITDGDGRTIGMEVRVPINGKPYSLLFRLERQSGHSEKWIRISPTLETQVLSDYAHYTEREPNAADRFTYQFIQLLRRMDNRIRTEEGLRLVWDVSLQRSFVRLEEMGLITQGKKPLTRSRYSVGLHPLAKQGQKVEKAGTREMMSHTRTEGNNTTQEG